MSEAWRGDDLGQVAVEEQSLEMQSCATKLSTIREVLLRRHMKVAFFGRYGAFDWSFEPPAHDPTGQNS